MTGNPTSPNVIASPTTDRVAFERWYADEGGYQQVMIHRDRIEDHYGSPAADARWTTWQAALTHERHAHAADVAAAERRGIERAAATLADLEYGHGAVPSVVLGYAEDAIRALLDTPTDTQPQEASDEP